MRIKITYIHVCVHECVCACMSTAGIIAAVVENRYAGHQSMSEAQANWGWGLRWAGHNGFCHNRRLIEGGERVGRGRIGYYIADAP